MDVGLVFKPFVNVPSIPLTSTPDELAIVATVLAGFESLDTLPPLDCSVGATLRAHNLFRAKRGVTLSLKRFLIHTHTMHCSTIKTTGGTNPCLLK